MAKIEIYSKDHCPYCVRAKALLESKGAKYEEFAVDKDAERFQEMLQRAPGRRTLPQIFINDQHIGGCDDLFACDKSGELDQLLAR
jgi:glutaredoxin 3